MTRVYRNPEARRWRTTAAPDVRAFHRSLPGYARTRLVEVPEAARELGVASVHVKEEAERFGLPAFKMLGASYAVARALAERYGRNDLPGLDGLRALVADAPVALVAATDGNHGRAVARMARLVGLPARIHLPVGVSPSARAAIAAEGAEVIEHDAGYDDVVRRAASDAERTSALLIQDTSWDGYERIPGWIVDGYSTMLREVDEQLADAGIPAADLIVVPVGVGAFAETVVRHCHAHPAAPSVLSVEPDTAPAVIASLEAGRPVTVETGLTIMAGLNCGTPTASGWPVLRDGLDAAVVVTDAEAARAVADLEAWGLDSGPCGAASLAGLRALVADRPLDPATRVVLLSTEGRTANPLPKD